MFIVTLIAANPHDAGVESEARDLLAEAGCQPKNSLVFGSGRAVDIGFGQNLGQAKTALLSLESTCDICVQPAENRVKKLMISDMDSTMIMAECIDELAEFAGIKGEIAAITERAMGGELDFAAALIDRVKLLEGLDESVIEECLHSRIRAMPGAGTLVATMHSLGCYNMLVSGGFHSFADPVGAGLGFNAVLANNLEIADGKLTGQLTGDIVDAAAKERALTDTMKKQRVQVSDTLAIGDGANDIPMLQAAGLGVAYHAKPAARKAADAFVAHNDLTALLLMQGIDEDQWIVVPER